MDISPFHRGELRAQELAGVSARGAGIRDFMPDQHRIFFELLPYMFLGTLDAAGWPLATVLTGAPGFVSSPDPRALRIDALPAAEDPAEPFVGDGAAVGLLGLDLSTRRRNRANGRVRRRGERGLIVDVTQSFGNCPQYIQARRVESVPRGAAPVETLSALSGPALRLVETADTLFVASASGAVGEGGGVDISHRGGRPGFVHVEGDRLTVPDFSGNRYFNTLGNLLVEPRASLLFVDFERGDMLQLQGRTAIDWTGDAAAQIAGAERLWHFTVGAGWFRPGALPLRWTFDSYAPTTERTGIWQA